MAATGTTTPSERHQKGLICVSEETRDWFANAVYRKNVMMIRGLPGAGKTIVGLELIAELRNPGRRIYYRTLKYGFELDEMQHSIQRRLNLPYFFVLDDCHLHLQNINTLLEWLQPELNNPNKNIAILLIGRHVPNLDSEEDESLMGLKYLEEIADDDRSRVFATSVEMTREVLGFIKPDWENISKARLEKLSSVTGGDLLLLDEALQIIQEPDGIDDFSEKELLESIRTIYFKEHKPFPVIRQLA